MQISDELIAARPGSMDSRPVMIVAVLVLPLSVVVIFLPRDEPIRWSWFWIAIAIATSIVAITGITDTLYRRMRLQLPSWAILTQLVLMIAACGAAIHAGGTQIGIYDPLLIVVLIIFVIFGDAQVVIFGAVVSFAALGVATWSNGVPIDQTLTLVLAHAICWGITATIVYLLVSSLRAEKANAETIEEAAKTLATVAQAGVRFTDLPSALDLCMPSLREVIPADRIVAFAVGSTRQLIFSPPIHPCSTSRILLRCSATTPR